MIPLQYSLCGEWDLLIWQFQSEEKREGLKKINHITFHFLLAANFLKLFHVDCGLFPAKCLLRVLWLRERRGIFNTRLLS